MDMLHKARDHAASAVEKAVAYNKQRWDNMHKEPDFKVGDLVLVSNANWTNLQGSRKLRDSFAGPFVIRALHGKNAVEVILTGELTRKHPTFPVSLIKKYEKSDRDKFPTRGRIRVEIPPLDKTDPTEISMILGEQVRKVNGRDVRLFWCRFKDCSSDYDKWLEEHQISNSSRLLREYRLSKRCARITDKPGQSGRD